MSFPYEADGGHFILPEDYDDDNDSLYSGNLSPSDRDTHITYPSSYGPDCRDDDGLQMIRYNDPFQSSSGQCDDVYPREAQYFHTNQTPDTSADAMMQYALRTGNAELAAQLYEQQQDNTYEEGWRAGQEEAVSQTFSSDEKQTPSATSRFSKLSGYVLAALAGKLIGQETEDFVKAVSSALLKWPTRMLSDGMPLSDRIAMEKKTGEILNQHTLKRLHTSLERSQRPRSRSTLSWLLGRRPGPKRRSSFSAPERPPSLEVEARRASYSDGQVAGGSGSSASSTSGSGSGSGSGSRNGSGSGSGWFSSLIAKGS